MRYAALFVAVFGFLQLPSTQAFESDLVLAAENAWARKTRSSMSAAAYVTFTNDGGKPVTIVSVSTPIAQSTTLHQSYEKDGIMRMDHVEKATLDAGESLELAPGGYHIMMMQLAHPLEEGTSFPVTLEFEDGRTQTIDVHVTGMAGPQMDSKSMDHHH